MPTATESTSNSTLRLSAIYRKLLDEIDELYDDNDMVQEGCHHKLPIGLYDQAVELVSQAVNDSLRIVSGRCPECDGVDIRIICGSCDSSPTPEVCRCNEYETCPVCIEAHRRFRESSNVL